MNHGTARIIKLSLLLIICSVPLAYMADIYLKNSTAGSSVNSGIDLFKSDNSMYFLGGLLSENGPAADNFENAAWKSVSKLNPRELRNKDEIWYRVPLPISGVKDPTLLLIPKYLFGIEVYFNQQRIFNYGSFSTPPPKKIKSPSHWPLILPLPGDLQKDAPTPPVVYVRNHYNEYLLEASMGHIYAGSLENLVALTAVHYLRFGFWKSCMGIVFLFLSGVAFAIFIFQWKDREYLFLSFGFFLLCAGIHNLEWRLTYIFDLSYITSAYMNQFSNTLLPVGILAFLSQLVEVDYKRFLRRLWVFHIVFVVFFIPYNTLHPSQVGISSLVFNTLIFCYLCACLFILIKSRALKYLKILSAASFIFWLLVVVDLARWTVWLNVYKAFPDGHIYSIGVLVLICAFSYIIIDSYKRTRVRARDYALEIEINERKLLQLESDNLQARLDVLISQLNPHFLFNTFGALISLIQKNQSDAVQFVEELSRVYRHLLQTQERKIVSLRSELEFTASYSYLVKKRFGKKVEITVSAAQRHLDYSVPPLSLQLLIENAIKHNVISHKNPLKITIETHSDDYLAVKNNYKKKPVLERPTKVGLNNLRQRYELLSNREIKIFSDEVSFLVKIPLLDGNKIEVA